MGDSYLLVATAFRSGRYKVFFNPAQLLAREWVGLRWLS